jgi:DNA invertase Pin-like site-specific DNA recombinase
MHPNTQALRKILRAIIYTRVSADRSGRARSPEEQEQDCRADCKRHGWSVGEVLRDNDVSATRHSKKDRPAYERLKEILRPGDVLVIWAASRAQRDLEAYVQLRNLCAERGVLWCYGGKIYDLNDRGDRLSTGFQALIDEDAAEAIREAVLRAQRANAIGGVAHGKIPYGYRALRNPNTGKIEKRVPHETQAPVVREIARRVLAGDKIYAIAQDLNQRGIPTARPSKGWTASSISALIKRPTYAGFRTHQGEVTSEGDWEPLIDPEDHAKILALMNDSKRLKHSGVAPEHLLSGIATCGVCGGRIRQTGGRYTQYVCVNFCVKRRQSYIDEMVEEAIIARLETATSIEEFADPHQKEALAEARILRAQLDEAVDLFSKGELSAASLARAESNMLPTIRDLERRGQAVVHPLVGELLGPSARATWELWPMADRKTVARALVRVTILPAPRGNVFRPEFVRFEWLN